MGRGSEKGGSAGRSRRGYIHWHVAIAIATVAGQREMGEWEGTPALAPHSPRCRCDWTLDVCVCVISFYIYPATSGPAGPRQLLAFLSSPRLLPCFLSPSRSPPPKREAADMAGLPRAPVYLKKKSKTNHRSPPTPDPKSKPASLPEGGPLPWPLPFSNLKWGGLAPPPPLPPLPQHAGRVCVCGHCCGY